MFKNTHIWIGSYLRGEWSRLFQSQPWPRPTHVMFCFVDHFEPDWNQADAATQLKRVEQWLNRYPPLAQKHKDADGCFPKHTFFYPAESYDRKHFDRLGDLCAKEFGEVEIHLHHDNDTEQGLRQKLEKAKADFVRHGFLGQNKSTGEISFAFIHGNWALNNSRQDGRWCGVNNESRILKSCGCYADFTLPSAPSETQTPIINSIYYDSGDETRPKSHNTARPVETGKPLNSSLMIIQGPLTLNWRRRKGGILPKIENADVTVFNAPTRDRIDLWINQRIAVSGRLDWIFIKIHTHGTQEHNMNTLLGDPMNSVFSYLESKYNDGKNFILHYVTAREMYNIIKAAEAGTVGQPNDFRDYLIERF